MGKVTITGLSVFAYPWDVVSLGTEAVLDELAELGIDTLELAANYHPITTLSPRSGRRRVISLRDGGLLFQPNPARYGSVRPQVCVDREVTAVWSLIGDTARRRGITVNAWTVGTFQPWLAEQVPSAARVLPTGDPIPATVCPSSPALADLLTGIAIDTVDRFGARSVRLEGIAHPGGTYGWVRPRVLAPLSQFATWLMSLCFCRGCRRAATAAGVDPEQARVTALALLDRELAAPEPEPTSYRIADVDPELRALSRVRREAVVSLVRHIAAGVGTVADEPRLTVWGPDEIDGSEGVDLEQVIDCLSGIQVESTQGTSAAIARRVAETQLPRRVDVIGLLPRPWDSAPADPAAVESEARAGASLGIDRMAIYQFGTRTPQDLARIVAACASGR